MRTDLHLCLLCVGAHVHIVGTKRKKGSLQPGVVSQLDINNAYRVIKIKKKKIMCWNHREVEDGFAATQDGTCVSGGRMAGEL